MNSLENIFKELRSNSNLCTAVEKDGRICFSGCKYKNLCEKHYLRFRKYSSVDLPKKKPKKCKFIDCENVYRAKGYCTVHYKKYIKSDKICHISDCELPVKAKNLCKKHYDTQWRLGDPLGKSNYKPDIHNELIKKGKNRYIPPRKNINCIVPKCEKNYLNDVIRKGLCKNHYYSWHKYHNYFLERKEENG